MKYLKAMVMAAAAALAIAALVSVAIPTVVEFAALAGLSALLFAAIGTSGTLTATEVKSQRKKTMTNCYIGSEKRNVTNRFHDVTNRFHNGDLHDQQANEKPHEKRHLTFRLAEADV